VRKTQGPIHLPVHAQVPGLQIEPWDNPQIEAWPLADLSLAGRNSARGTHARSNIPAPEYKRLFPSLEESPQSPRTG
jgi:hypothetical protein